MDRPTSQRPHQPSLAVPLSRVCRSRRRATSGRPAAEDFVDQIDRARRQGSRRLPADGCGAGGTFGTIRAVLAIALDLTPDSALRFVIDPLSLTPGSILASRTAGAWSRSTSVQSLVTQIQRRRPRLMSAGRRSALPSKSRLATISSRRW